MSIVSIKYFVGAGADHAIILIFKDYPLKKGIFSA